MRSINSRDILRKKLRYNLILVGHYCGSGMFIPDPISHIRLFFHPGSDFYHPGSRIRIKEVSILAQKWFLSSRKNNPGSSSRIRIPDPDTDFYSSRILNSGVENPGYRIRIRNTVDI